MCFIEKMNCIWIHKREDRVPDPVCTYSCVGSGIRAQSLTHDHSLALYFLHESLKFVRMIREKNRYIKITCTPFFHLFMGLLDGFPYCRTGEFIRFSICSTKARTLPSYANSTSLDPESEDSTIVLLLNFGGILLQKSCPIGRAKNMYSGFSSGIHHNIQKA